jgi:hypothetical protein
MPSGCEHCIAAHMACRRAVTFEKSALEPTGQVTATHTLDALDESRPYEEMGNAYITS